LDIFRHYVIPTIALRFNWLTLLDLFNHDWITEICTWSEIGAWVMEKPQVIRDFADFADSTYILPELNDLLILGVELGVRVKLW